MTGSGSVLDGVAIDPSSATPPYEQVRAAVVTAVREGRLPAGTRLPPVRRLAEDLGVAAGTVARAYRELEAGAVIETRGRAGSFVRTQEDMLEQHARDAARAYAEAVTTLGLDEDRAVELARQAVRRIAMI